MEQNDGRGVDVDDVLSRFKLTGKYYMKFFVLVVVATLTNELYCYNYVLGAPDIEYRCRYTDCQENEYFVNGLMGMIKDIKCHKYPLIINETLCSIDNLEQSKPLPCQEWVYENPSSFVGEFDLGCQDWKRVLLGTVHCLGNIFGLLLIGPLSDKIGRKKTLVLTGLIGGVFGLARSVTYSYWTYVALELLEAVIGDTCTTSFTYSIEMATKENRVLFNSITQVTYGVGDILMAIIGFIVPYWRNYLRVMYAPAIVFVLYWYYMDESVRWLLSTGRKEEAIEILKKAAVTDSINIDDDTLNRLQSKIKPTDISLINLLRTTINSKTILLRFLGCVWMWITCSFTSHTFMISSVTLDGNMYLNYGLTGAMYIGPSLLLVSILNKYKRRKPMVASFIVTGIICVIHTMVPSDYTWTSLIMFLFGTFASSFSYPIVYLYTSEIFPTYSRNTMHAVCSVFGRLGAVLAPQTPLLIKFWSGFPALLIGGLCLIAGVISAKMPDPADDALPDNVEEAEAIGIKMNTKNQKEGESRW